MRILIASVMAMIVVGCASTSSQMAAEKSPGFNGHLAYEQARNERINREIEAARLRQFEAEAMRPTSTRQPAVEQPVTRP
jgi:hypothetical protein